MIKNADWYRRKNKEISKSIFISKKLVEIERKLADTLLIGTNSVTTSIIDWEYLEEMQAIEQILQQKGFTVLKTNNQDGWILEVRY